MYVLMDLPTTVSLQAKRLVGYSTAVRRLHWSHSCVVSFCGKRVEHTGLGRLTWGGQEGR